MQTVNAFEIRGRVRKDIDFLEGAWVEFYDDITVDLVLKAQSAQGTNDIQANLSILLGQIADWNIADNNGLMEINVENVQKLPLKIITWMSETQSEILNSITDKKKELPGN